MHSWLKNESIQPYYRLLSRIILTLLAAFILFNTVPVLFSFFLPFIMAFIVASIFNPLICLLQKKWNVPRGILSVLMMLIAMLFVSAILGGFIYALGREVVNLAQNIDEVIEYLRQSIEILSAHTNWMLHFMPAASEDIFSGISDGLILWLREQGTLFADAVIVRTVNATTQVGVSVIVVVIFIMASYFMMADYPQLIKKIYSLLTPKTYESYVMFKDVTFSALGKYFRAQFVMAFVVFILSIIGLMIIRQSYLLLIALLLAVLDFLPLIGTSAVLMPWAIFNILTGDITRGFYLIAMNMIIFILRRIIEPKIVSSQTGLSPLTALASIYFGMRLGGIIGLILGPIIAMMFVSIYKAGLFDGWIHDIKAVVALIKHRK